MALRRGPTMGATRDVRIQHFGEMAVLAVRHGETGPRKHPITSTFILSLQESLSYGPLVLLQYDVDPIDVQDFV